MVKSSRFLGLLSCFFLVSPIVGTGCGSTESASQAPVSEGKVGTTEFVLQDSPNLKFEGESLSGEGKAAAKLPAGEIKSKKNFALNFTLDDGGSVTLAAYATEKLDKSIAVKFLRSGKVLKATLSATSKDIDISKAFGNVDATKEIAVLVDIHNDETPAHLLAWTADIASPGEANALFNSEKVGDGESPGNGQGTFWGLVLSKAKVTKAAASEAKFKEE